MSKTDYVTCPQCGRNFPDQLHPKRGYVFPVHVLNPALDRRERYRECPGSLKPIAVEHRAPEPMAQPATPTRALVRPTAALVPIRVLGGEA